MLKFEHLSSEMYPPPFQMSKYVTVSKLLLSVQNKTVNRTQYYLNILLRETARLWYISRPPHVLLRRMLH